MIKTVSMAKPMYSMSCFLIPKTTCDEINGFLSGVWWGKDNDKRKIS